MEIISYGDNFNKHFKLFTFSSQTLYLDYSLSSELTPSIECKMCGNEVLHVAAQRNCFERWERPAFFRKQSLHCDCKLPYFYKKLCTCFCYLFIVIRNAFEK